MESSHYSLCMICKNESLQMPTFIAWHKEFFDDWSIVDTGSTDGTLDILREENIPFHEIPWKKDFSHARNASLSHCQGDWIFALDADERISKEDQAYLKQQLGTSPVDAISVPIKNYVKENVLLTSSAHDLAEYRPPDGSYLSVFGGEEDFGYIVTELIRIFRKGAGFSWRNPIHEVLVAKDPKVARIEGLFIHHLGSLNLEGKREDKHEKYVEISQEMATKLEETRDPKALFEAVRFLKNAEDRLKQLCRVREKAPQDLQVLKAIAEALMEQKRESEAFDLLDNMVGMDRGSLELHLLRSSALITAGRAKDALSCLKAEFRQFKCDAMFHFHIAKAALAAGDGKAALSHSRRAADLAPASKMVGDFHNALSRQVRDLSGG